MAGTVIDPDGRRRAARTVDGVMAERHPDHEEWPRYWRAIRFAAVGLLVGILIVGGAALLPRPESLPLRIVMELVIGGMAVAVATRLARRVERRRERRSA